MGDTGICCFSVQIFKPLNSFLFNSSSYVSEKPFLTYYNTLSQTVRHERTNKQINKQSNELHIWLIIFQKYSLNTNSTVVLSIF